ncbi:MAG: hypothetical protein Q4E59_01440 [Bacteroidales bacterium]|nr:hypothetical protein [Bacteroidales bacterium]
MKNLIKKLAFSALLLVGVGNAQAQNGYEVPTINPEYATMADEIIGMQLSDPDKANKQFTKLLRKIQKSKEDLLSVGQYFLDKNIYPCANQCAKQLYTLDPTYIPGLMFNGEVCMLRKDYGAAGQKFDEVLTVDSTYVPALKRNAFVYKNINPHVAIEMLERIKNVEPSNVSADKELGDIYYNLDEFKSAVASYKSYFDAQTQNDSTDIRAAENYLQSLYATQSFMDLAQLVTRFEKLDGKDMVFKRMKLFAAVENYELDLAEQAMGYISNKEYPDSFYLYLDYAYAANLLTELADIPGAIGYYELALKRDSTKVSGYKELANLYRRNRQISEGIETYKKYIHALGENVQLSDYFGLGQQYVAASQQADITPEEKAKYVQEGDSIFLAILAEKPDSYQAVLMRAAINITDGSVPEDNVKALYEEALTMMEGKENTEAGKLQALRYLAFYAVQKDQLEDARKYTDEILVIEPENAFAKQIDTYLKSLEQ